MRIKWKKVLVGATFGLGLTIVLVILMSVAYVGFVRHDLDIRLTQLKATKGSRFLSQPPAFRLQERFRDSELSPLLQAYGYRLSQSATPEPGHYYVQSSPQKLTLILNRPAFKAPGVSLDSLTVEATLIRDGSEFAVERIADSRTEDSLESFEHAPIQLGRFFAGRMRNQNFVNLSEMPVSLRLAVIEVEDSQFFEHSGVSMRGTARALWRDLLALRFVEGGSTITQQLMKNLFFSNKKMLSRKFKEMFYAFVAETQYPKEEILEAYLNEVYLGQWGTHEIHGMAEAAWYYFGRPLSELTLSQCALLTGIIRAPNLYHPHVNAQRALTRRNFVLKKMLDAGHILDEEYQKATLEPLDVVPPEEILYDSGYFMDLVLAELPSSVADRLDRETLTVYISLDPYLQNLAAQSLAAHLSTLERSYASLKQRAAKGVSLQGAMIAIDPKQCTVLALQGGSSFRETQFNRILRGKRQAGSLFKPFVYLTAFASELDPPVTAFTEIDDSPFEWSYEGNQTWSPKNYDEQFRGPVTVAQALQQSVNVPTAKIAQLTGLDALAKTLKSAGISSSFLKIPSLSLGAADVTPMELALAYTTLARVGNRCKLRPYFRVFDEYGNLIQENPLATEPGLDPKAVTDTVEILKGVFTQGTAASAQKSAIHLSTFAGKTGTTNDFTDAWFVGFSPSLLVLTWVGYDLNEPVGLPGAVGALPLWIKLTENASSFIDGTDFEEIEAPP